MNQTLLRSNKSNFIVEDPRWGQRTIPKDNKRSQLFLKADDIEGDLIGEDLILELSVSSEEPYERWWYTEILDHSIDSIDLSRLNNKANALFNHRHNEYIAVIEKAWISDNKLYNQYRFSSNALASQIVKDINDGIISKASIGYMVDELVLEKQSKEEPNIYRATKWMPYESSIVTIAADDTIGVGRSYYDLKPSDPDLEQTKPVIEEKTMDEPTTIEINETDIRQQERDRLSSLYALGEQYKQYDCQPIIEKAINEGLSIEQTRSLVLDKVVEKQQPLARTTDPLGLSNQEQRRYSVCRAILAALTKDWSGAGLEKEVHDALCKRNEKLTGIKNTNNIKIPFFDLMVNQRQANDGYRALIRSAAYRNLLQRAYQRDFQVGDAIQGGNLVETELDDARFIEIFRNAAMVIQAGAQTLTGLVGNLDIPKQLTGSTDGTNTYWVAEGADPGEIDATFGLLQIRPKTLGAWMVSTRLMLLQSSIDIEQFMRRELAINVALGVDRAAIMGTGTNDEPLGILNTPGVNAITNGANGAPLNWPRAVQYETKIATANADVGSMGWLGNARTRGELKSTEKFAGTSGQTIWMDRSNAPGEGLVNGYPYYCSNSVPGNLTKGTGTDLSALIFGKWSELFFAEWGNTEILANPYGSQYLSGGIQIRILHTCDIGVRHPECFSAATDIATPLSDAA